LKPEPETTSAPTVNWAQLLEQTKREYEQPPARGVPHGVQKEAIQNGWGARAGRRAWGFSVILHAETDGHPALLTLTDSGTVGLTGDLHFNVAALGEDENIPSDQRLARFEAMYESGGETSGPGLFGRGKLIFNAASKKRTILYDSRTKDGDYRLGIRWIRGRDYHQLATVMLGGEAEKELAEQTDGRLVPLAEAGTRITIVDPVDELLDATRSGDLLQSIEETWWEIILKYDASISVQVLPGKPQRAGIPKDFGSLPEKSGRGWHVVCRENIPLRLDGGTYRVKRLHLLIPPPKNSVGDHLLGLRFHRRGMVVGRVNLSGIPGEISDRFFGYVLLDRALEDAVAGQEGLAHYGITSPNRSPYRNLRQLCQTESDQFLEDIGLKRRTSSAEERVRRLAEDAQADLNKILSRLGVPGFGKGRPKPAQLHLSVTQLDFPRGTNLLTMGDEIKSFAFRLENATRRTERVWWRVFTSERDTGELETLVARTQVSVRAGGFLNTEDLTIALTSPPYAPYTKVACTCELTDDDGVFLQRKSFYFYIDLKPEPADRWAELRLSSADWPRDTRRLDYSDSLTGIRYEFENLSAEPMSARLRARTLWARESNADIEEVGATDLQLGPFEGKMFECPPLNIVREIYEEVGGGKVNLRCHAAALEASALWQKGQRLAESTVPFFLNMDPGYGFWEGTDWHEGGTSEPRSEPRAADAGGRTWRLVINITHPAYLQTEADDQRRRDYLFEEMARQTIAVLLRMSQEDALATLAALAKSEKLVDLSQADLIEKVAYRVVDQVLAAYYAG